MLLRGPKKCKSLLGIRKQSFCWSPLFWATIISKKLIAVTAAYTKVKNAFKYFGAIRIKLQRMHDMCDPEEKYPTG